MADYSLSSNEDTSLDGFQMDVEFVKFAEEQLSLDKHNSDIKVIYTRRENPESSAKPSRHALISEKSKRFMKTDNEEESASHPKLKPLKKESAFIHQKILKLQKCASKTNEEIYGSDLLEAIRDFENFVAKTWGRGENERKMKTCKFVEMPSMIENHDLSSSSPTIDSVNQLPISLKKRTSSGMIDDESELTSSTSGHGDTDKSASKDALLLNTTCTFCQRMCSCKVASLPKSENVSTSKATHEFSSKGVNTEIPSHLSTATNTIVLESTATGSARSEQLSKLTIRTHNPIAQQIDCGCGGEGGMSNQLQEFMKIEELEAHAESNCSSETLEVQETCKETFEIFSKRHPTDDMKAALELVNKALLHGHTGREVAAAMSVILNEWFQLVGSKTVDANAILEYLNIFSSYSPQLVRYMVNLPDENGITALHYAVSYGNFHVVSKLIETNVVDVNKANKAGYTSIMLASLTDVTTTEQEQVLQKLIGQGNVNTRAAQHGQTALMLAASHGRFKLVKLLLEAGAEVNAQDEDGSTALMCAVEHGHADIVQCLLAQPGCNPNLTDNDGLNALNVAMEAGHKDVAVLLYAHMHFFKQPLSPGSVDERLLLSQRSKSMMNTPTCNEPFSLQPGKNTRHGDLRFVAKKQHSSIN